jgi:hypothetical protein
VETLLLAVPPVICDRLVGSAPVELMAMSESDRKLKLAPLIHALRLVTPVNVPSRTGPRELRDMLWRKALLDEVPWAKNKVSAVLVLSLVSVRRAMVCRRSKSSKRRRTAMS